MKRFLIVIAFALLICGCSSMRYTSSSAKFAIGKTSYISDYRVIQTLNAHFALVRDNRLVDNPLVIAIRTAEDSDILFYDGQTISGQFVMIDTYTYETAASTAERIRMRTVPLVVPKKEYQTQKSQPNYQQRF